MASQLPAHLREFLNRTGNLLIHLSDRCNLSCKHCYLNASLNGTTMLPIDVVKNTLHEANELGLKSVQISGGEPLLYPDIREVLRTAKGKSFKFILSTNATLISDDIATLLAGMDASTVVSIDGPRQYHDAFRGKKGSFEMAKTGLARLVDHKVPVKVVMTVCRESLPYLDWCAEWANEMKADMLQFQPLNRVGRGQGIEDLRLSHEMLHDLFIHLNDLTVKYAKRGMRITMTYQSRDYMLAHPCRAFVCDGKKCHRGVEKELKKIVIREDGSILPELVDIDRRFAIGSLYKNTLTKNILNFLENGYAQFDQLCRDLYHQIVPNYPSPLIPWNEILTEHSKKSHSFRIDQRKQKTPHQIPSQPV